MNNFFVQKEKGEVSLPPKYPGKKEIVKYF